MAEREKKSGAQAQERFPAVDSRRFAVILVRPGLAENVGLAARGMANTGFSDLRIVGDPGIAAEARRTAVHASFVLDRARFFRSLPEALADLNLVLGSTARIKRGYPVVGLREALSVANGSAPGTKVGLVFGNERTGQTAEELGLTNCRFHIPQARRQPSYNLGVAVTLVLFTLACPVAPASFESGEPPLTHAEQLKAAADLKVMLDRLGFMRRTNREFITARVQDIFLRTALSAKDRDIILAMFRRALLGRRDRGTAERKEQSDDS
jgi:tRNA/rRNA methyltransferase